MGAHRQGCKTSESNRKIISSMRRYRFFTDQDLQTNVIIELDEELSHYIQRVLRLKINDEIYLFNNTGNEFFATIDAISKHTVTAKIINVTTDNRESPLKIHLAQVIGKGDKMDLVIQKATELGVTSIIPLYSQHTVVKNVPDRNEHKLQHWHKIAVAASCQSWRSFVPKILEPMMLTDWIRQNNSTHKLILTPDAGAQHIKNLQLDNDVAILIGPEGGFSDIEVTLAQQNNFTSISLGPRILRTETAGLATIACIQTLFGDM